MSEESLKVLFMILVGTSVLNFAIAIISRVNTKDSSYNWLIIYWPTVILTFVGASILTGNPKEMAYSYFFHFFSCTLMLQIFHSAVGLKSRWRIYLSMHVIAMMFSTYLIESQTVSFALSLLPTCLSFSLPFLRPIYYVLWTNKKNSNWVETSLAFVFATTILHHFNFIIFRNVPGTEAIGFSITIALYQCLSVFLPLLISKKKEIQEKNNLQNVIMTLSGEIQHSNRVDELYTQIEYLIDEKEKYNLQLKEEREINEILIKTISHDLATPLTVISNYSELLKRNNFDHEKYLKILDKLSQSSSKSLNMISRIRNAILTRSQAQMVRPHPVRIHDCLEQTLELFETRLLEKDIKLNFKNSIAEDTSVLADKDALIEHVLSNVLSNAIKFSYPNSEILIETKETEENVILIIRDFGIGYKNSDSKYMSVNHGTQGEIGTGFGLIILNYFINQFSGSISIQPEAQGTSVILKLLKAFPIRKNIQEDNSRVQSLS